MIWIRMVKLPLVQTTSDSRPRRRHRRLLFLLLLRRRPLSLGQGSSALPDSRSMFRTQPYLRTPWHQSSHERSVLNSWS